jgi:hypothetical protein
MPYSNIDDPKKYFQAVLYTGDDTNNRQVSVNFSPDWTWLKSRSLATAHILYDRIRGIAKRIVTNNTDAEEDGSALSWTNSGCTTNSFTVDRGSNNSQNNTGSTYVAWNWLAGGTGVSNTSGSITSTVSANTTSGFSIVGWTGTTGVATVGHGLGTTPSIIIVKNRSVVASWVVYHKSLGATKYLFLNLTLGQQTDSLAWNNTQPDSTKFTINNYTNGSGNNLIAYCFAEVKGYSKFGSYTGNGSDDGTFVYTGFKPAFVLVKRTDSTGYWYLWDSARRTYNYNGLTLFPNDSSAESSYTPSNPVVDFLSNGFKLRGSYPEVNASGGTIIYMAFAENPFVSSKGIPCTAR